MSLFTASGLKNSKPGRLVGSTSVVRVLPKASFMNDICWMNTASCGSSFIWAMYWAASLSPWLLMLSASALANAVILAASASATDRMVLASLTPRSLAWLAMLDLLARMCSKTARVVSAGSPIPAMPTRTGSMPRSLREASPSPLRAPSMAASRAAILVISPEGFSSSSVRNCETAPMALRSLARSSSSARS